MFYQTKTARRPPKGPKCCLLSLWPWPLIFDLQARPSEGPNMSSVWIWRKSVQRFPDPRYFMHTQKLEAKAVSLNIDRTKAAESAEKCRILSRVTLAFDLWLWPLNSSKRGTKHVHLSLVPDIFHTQTKKHRLAVPKTEPSAVHCVR